MTSSKRITVRLPASDADAIEQIARERRRATGDAVSTSDVIRAAVRAYLKENQGEQDA